MHYTHMRRRILISMKGKKPSDLVDADGDEPMTVIADSSGLRLFEILCSVKRTHEIR